MKKKQRKWVRFERDHPMSLWQGDWKHLTVKGKSIWLIAFMDDASFVASRNRDEAQRSFKDYLQQKGIRHIVAGISHPQTTGKIERFFEEVERRIHKFGSVHKVVYWHNVIKPHMSLNFDEPVNVFWYRLSPERTVGYAMRWWI